jgi:S1-C subfamily serine protease
MISLAFALSLLAPQKEEESTLQKIDREVGAIVEKVRPSVVQVTVMLSIDGQSALETLSFAGVVYSKDGHIVTDASGVENASEIRVSAGTRTLKAALLALDRRTGVAVLKADSKELVPASLSETPARAGSVAIVVGNPFGLRGGASTGTVSGSGRSIQVAGRRYDNMIQMSTPVNPGDCGGFVADSSGRLLGLVHSAYAPEASGVEAGRLLPFFKMNPRDVSPVAGQSVSFATPAAWVRFSADRIVKHGRMVRGWLGLSLRPLDPAVRAQLGLEEGTGVEVAHIEREGPAKASAIALRDVLVEFDGKPVKDLEALQWAVAQVEEPRTVKVAFLRNRERQEAELRVEIDPQK